jgi:hypothetical protein
MCEVKRHGGAKVLERFIERVCKPGKPAHRHMRMVKFCRSIRLVEISVLVWVDDFHGTVGSDGASGYGG